MLKDYLPTHTRRVLSIASGLDNSLAFLENDEAEVIAIDSNPSQIYLSKLKIAAIQYLSYGEFLVFLGFQNGDSLRIYESLKNHLDADTKNYFDTHLYLIENKLIHAGRFEYYLNLFKKKILPLVASKRKIERFMMSSSLEEQKKLYKRDINHLRFSLLFRIFFSKKVMSRLGRDKSFFVYSKGNLSMQLKKRIDMGLTSTLNSTNPYLQYAMLNQFKELPYYAQKETFYKIKRNISNITVIQRTFDEALKEYDSFDFMNLSDIFEYMSKDISRYEELIKNACNPKARIAFWNMMNERAFDGLYRINSKEDLLKDRAMYYQDFLVYEVNYD